MLLIDANVILRYLLEDIEEQFKKASKDIENENILVPYEIIAEVIYVLLKVYNIEKNIIVHSINGFFQYPNINSPDDIVLREALVIYKENNIDFVDCLLCARNRIYHYGVRTFDKKLQKILEK